MALYINTSDAFWHYLNDYLVNNAKYEAMSVAMMLVACTYLLGRKQAMYLLGTVIPIYYLIICGLRILFLYSYEICALKNFTNQEINTMNDCIIRHMKKSFYESQGMMYEMGTWGVLATALRFIPTLLSDVAVFGGFIVLYHAVKRALENMLSNERGSLGKIGDFIGLCGLLLGFYSVYERRAGMAMKFAGWFEYSAMVTLDFVRTHSGDFNHVVDKIYGLFY